MKLNKLDQSKFVAVALPVPIRQVFDYLIPAHLLSDVCVGCRVKVGFGGRQLVGVVVQLKMDSDLPVGKLKEIQQVFDNEPVLDGELHDLMIWVSSYYLAPIGEVFSLALPNRLRQGKPLVPSAITCWQLARHMTAQPDLQRAPLQLAILQLLNNREKIYAEDVQKLSSGWRQAITGLLKKGCIEEIKTVPKPAFAKQTVVPSPQLTGEQRTAVKAMDESNGFGCHVLMGVTGSGKTEVYFSKMDAVIAAARQVLYLVPEIGLTPQLIQRVRQRFAVPVVVLHSALSDTQRHNAWWQMRNGKARILIGTRSAVFCALQSPGLIVVDEEHDASLKQQEGVRYHARDVAIYRAKALGIPIILGSATPSSETCQNIQSGRYQVSYLNHRIHHTPLPQIGLIDLNKEPSADGLTPTLIQGLRHTLEQGEQAMLFLNRRGYAPALFCLACKQVARCQRCDANLIVHKTSSKERCHHCGYENQLRKTCAQCGAVELTTVGEGTQKLEEAVLRRLPQARILRLDRDAIRKRGDLEQALQAIAENQVDLIIGTQLISKGHDFPNLGFVGVVGADDGLYSSDYRAEEHLFAQLLQVAGRAGRRKQTGTVMIQTLFPQHPFFNHLREHDFNGFMQQLLAARAVAHYPPFYRFALFRASAVQETKAMQFLRGLEAQMKRSAPVECQIMQSIAAPMARRAGRHRGQLLVIAQSRQSLNRLLSFALVKIENHPALKKSSRAVRWNLDVDPVDLS